MEKSMEVSKKLKIELAYDPAIWGRCIYIYIYIYIYACVCVCMSLDIYPKEFKAGFPRDICTPMFITALFTVTKMWKQPKSL